MTLPDPMIPFNEKSVQWSSSMKCLDCKEKRSSTGTSASDHAVLHAGKTGHVVTSELKINTRYTPTDSTVLRIREAGKSGKVEYPLTGRTRQTDGQIRQAVYSAIATAASNGIVLTSANDVAARVYGGRSRVLDAVKWLLEQGRIKYDETTGSLVVT